ncbi:peptidase inhibitor family I36 protein [Streptomyces sp. NPDC056796]|uniref:peptidase inhibitor family I36 protein n=1 Tax=Streptomyces sp. NPDC056796 TaxID=3345947 RepID=UPI0036C81BE5
MRITMPAVAAVSLLLSSAAVASPASAAPVRTPAATAVCSIDHFCLYEHSDGTGRRGSYLNGTDDVKRQNIPSVRSGWNRTNQYWCVWSQDEYMGTKVIVQPNEGLRQLGGAFRSALPASAARC